MELSEEMMKLEIPLEDADELYHHGIKGMRWGIRRYQNKDGSLTKAGQKRYDKEVRKLKDEKKELRNKERVKKKQAKLDDLKNDVDKMKKSVEDPETPEQKKARLMNSTNAKELYENRELFTTAELAERINRIDTEARLQSKIVEKKKESGYDWVNNHIQKTSSMVNNAANLYKNLDSAYNTFANSTGGKILEKELGFKFPKGEKPKRQWNKEDFNKIWERRKELSDDEMRDFNNALKNEVNARQNMDKINGTDKGGNKNGMSRQDVEDLINEMLDERNLNHSDMNESVESYDTFMHHGIKGMKWGVHRFYNADGTRTAAGKKRENEAKQERRDGTKESGKSEKKGITNLEKVYSDGDEFNTFVNDFKKKIGNTNSKTAKEFKTYNAELLKARDNLHAKTDESSKALGRKRLELENAKLEKYHKKYPNDIGWSDEFQDYTINTDKGRRLSDKVHREMSNHPDVIKLKKTVDKTEKNTNEIYGEKSSKLKDKMSSLVLNELGYEDTAETRQYVSDNLLRYLTDDF